MALPRRGVAPRRRASFASVAALALVTACRAEKPRAPVVVDLLTAPSSSVEIETRRYLFGVDGRDPLLAGWSPRTDRDRRRDHLVIWADAKESVFGLDVLRVEDKQALVTVSAYPASVQQEIQVAINGRPLRESFTIPSDDREIRFVIPAETLHVGRNELAFRHSFVKGSRNPRDARRYAAAYSSLLMGPECLRLRPAGTPEPPRVDRGDGGRTLSITGPAAVAWTLDVPAGAVFESKISVPSKSDADAEVTLEARTGGEWTKLAETVVRRPWIGAKRVARLSADLGSIAGRRAELRIVVRPPACSAMLTTVRMKRAVIALQSADRP